MHGIFLSKEFSTSGLRVLRHEFTTKINQLCITAKSQVTLKIYQNLKKVRSSKIAAFKVMFLICTGCLKKIVRRLIDKLKNNDNMNRLMGK